VRAAAPRRARKDGPRHLPIVGDGRAQYSDLANDRSRRNLFSCFDVVWPLRATRGLPALLTPWCRVKSIFRRPWSVVWAALEKAAPSVHAPRKRNLALALLRYPRRHHRSRIPRTSPALPYPSSSCAAFSVFSTGPSPRGRQTTPRPARFPPPADGPDWGACGGWFVHVWGSDARADVLDPPRCASNRDGRASRGHG